MGSLFLQLDGPAQDGRVVQRALAPDGDAAGGEERQLEEVRRLVSQGGVRLNNDRVGEAAAELDTTETKEVLLQVGKLKFLKIVFE